MSPRLIFIAACVVAAAAQRAQAPQIQADGPNLNVAAELVTITQTDGQSITSADIIAMQGQLAFATSEITRLSTMESQLAFATQEITRLDNLVTTLTSQVGTATVAAQITSTIDDRLNALPIDLETGTINLVISADLSNTSGWRVNTVVIDRVPFTGATDGLPVPINAHRVNEQTHAADNVSCYGRFPETNLIAVDPMKSYKVGIWIKSTGRDMRNFFGFRVFGADGVLIAHDTDWVNPYFKISRSDMAGWNYHTGILRPADTPNTNSMHVSAETTSAQDWKLPANASFVILRFGSCYGDGDGQGTSWFAYPQMAEVFPGDGVGAGVDAAQGNNLVDFADFADLRTWQNGDLNIEATAWNDNKTTVMASAVYESVHDAIRICYSTTDTGVSGFAQTNMMKVSATNKYEASIWIKSNDTSMDNYVGFYVFDANFEQIRGFWDNPYFRGGEGDSPYFVFHSFALWPAGTDDGRPETQTRQYMTHPDTSGYRDWILPPQAAYISLRWGACHGDGDGTGASWFVYPSVQQSFGDKLAGLAINRPATAVRSLGRYNIQNATYNGVPGTVGTNPSPWVIAHDGLGFDLAIYSAQITSDSTQEMVVRMCATYTDDAAGSQSGTTMRLRRITASSTAYGNAAPYSAGHVFWTGLFPNTWSGARLQHHRCGDWFVLEDNDCGFSWGSTCSIDFRTVIGGNRFVLTNLNLEAGVRRRV